jgi:serine/threonine-protein kinase
VDWEREAAAQPSLRPQLEKLRALEGIAALNPEAAPDTLIGKTLSRYRIRERIGAGGMGVVYRAEDRSLRRPVALKVLPPDLVASEERRRRLLREARTEAAVVHPSIAAVHEVGEAEGNIFIAMEWVEGETLRERIGDRPMPIREVLRIAAEMAEGLAHAHQAHVIHRDFKPANVVVRPDGHVKILDFGLAKLTEEEIDAKSSELSQSDISSAEATGAGKVMGTPAYMSPEQVRGEPLDARSDLFAFGSTLYEMATGSMPFRGETSADTLASILRSEPASPRQLNPQVPPGLEEIIGKCLEKDPQDRYPSADGIAAELRALALDLDERGGLAASPATAKRRWSLWYRAAGAGALIVLLGAAVAIWRHVEPAPGKPSETPSIAVLRFDNLGRDPANAVFADGIHHDILTQLSKIRALKVIARTSIEQLDPNLSVSEIGDRLRVTTVLEGAVQRAKDRVRINVQLIDCKTQTHLWAETYDRKLTAANIFGIQTEIATSVASALRATLSAEEEQRIATMPTENLAAYQAYLLGKQSLAKFSSDSLAEAGDHFRRAIALDPSFALAHVGLATFYLSQIYMTGLPPDELLAKAQAATDKALELDDRLGEAYVSLAEIREHRVDPEGAEAAFKRALELNPNNTTAYSGYGYLLRHILGRPEEALAVHRKAIELDPLSAEIIGLLGSDLSALGRSDEALAWWNEALELDPSLPIHAVVGDHYWMALGQLDQAVSWYAKAIELDPGDPNLPAYLGWLFLDLGAPDEAERWFERTIALGAESLMVSFCSAMLPLYRDQYDEAVLDAARKSLAQFPPNQTPRWLVRNHALRAGRYSEARALYENFLPELLEDDEPRIASFWRYTAAIDLALVLYKTGEQERADLLLERALQHIQTVPRLSFSGHWVADVQIYALQGKKKKALAALRQAIDQGWRTNWWYYLQRDPNLESLHGEPEFQAMVKEIKADMSAQLAHVREMERAGELAAISRGRADLQ